MGRKGWVWPSWRRPDKAAEATVAAAVAAAITAHQEYPLHQHLRGRGSRVYKSGCRTSNGLLGREPCVCSNLYPRARAPLALPVCLPVHPNATRMLAPALRRRPATSPGPQPRNLYTSTPKVSGYLKPCVPKQGQYVRARSLCLDPCVAAVAVTRRGALPHNRCVRNSSHYCLGCQPCESAARSHQSVSPCTLPLFRCL